MGSDEKYGNRLVAPLIDSYAATDPERVWASVPRDDHNLSRGFLDITYKQFANAINHASWWLKRNIRPLNNPQPLDSEVLAYAGPKDLRYPILAIAVVKVGKQLLLPSPFASPDAKRHVLNITRCSTYLHASTMNPLVDQVTEETSGIRILEIPELIEWMKADEAPLFPYNKSWDEGKSDPWLIFHTSGTTGLPKPIVYTNLMMTSLDAAKTMPDADSETMNDHFKNARWYTPLPTLHLVGMTVALQLTVFLNTVVVIGPPDPTTADIAVQIMEFGNVSGAMLPPSLIEDLCRNATGLECLRKLKYIYFAGAPLPQQVADKLLGYGKLKPAMGSTEAGAYFIQIRDENDWNYYTFRPSMGAEFEKRTETLYELVFHRRPGLERWQQVFYVYPELDRFPTKDLWTMHPYQPNSWRYAGRTDDLIIFSHGEDLYSSSMENVIEKHPEVGAALIGGHGRVKPFLIIEMIDDQMVDDKGENTTLDSLWPTIETANKLCSEYVRLSKDHVIFTDPLKKLARTIKGTISRHQSIELYSDEIDRLYRENR